MTTHHAAVTIRRLLADRKGTLATLTEHRIVGAARLWGLCPATVRRRIAIPLGYGPTRGAPRRLELEPAELRRLRDSGMGWAAIGAAVGCSRSTAARRCPPAVETVEAIARRTGLALDVVRGVVERGERRAEWVHRAIWGITAKGTA